VGLFLSIAQDNGESGKGGYRAVSPGRGGRVRRKATSKSGNYGARKMGKQGKVIIVSIPPARGGGGRIRALKPPAKTSTRNAEKRNSAGI